MSDMIFQGTVLGPLLWNIFFKDAGSIIRGEGFKDLVFADDINGMRFIAVTRQTILLKQT